MKKVIFIITYTTVALILYGSDGDYAVSKISPALLKNANAVLRFENIKFEILSTKDAIETNHYVITILNENADDWAECSEYYDKLQEINSIEGILYDANGKQLKKIKTKDAQDISGVSDYSLMDDKRIKKHNFYYRVYPYTIEYEIVVHYKNTLFFPRWIPQGNEKLSVEHSEINIVCPTDYQFRYKAFKYNSDPVTAIDKNKKTSTWTVKDMPAIIKESFGPPWHELTTVVIFGPSEFQVGDYKGNMVSWQDFGKFVYSLKQGRDGLPANIKQTVHQLTDDVNDEKKKIQLLYEYMQKNTRYISVQLGIGGWQPFDATYVASKGYGDCKALVNYMYSILKEAGITSFYTLVRAGRNAEYITDDFPSQQFNHVILCVPVKKDTMWLECTDQTLPAGYLGDFTCNRYALLINENGGYLVHTPKYGLTDNLQMRKLKAVLGNDASLQIQVSTSYKGLQQDDVHGMINYLSKDKVKEYLQKQLDFPTYDLAKFEYNENKSTMPEVEEKLDLYVSNYASITGKRLFIIPNVMSRSYTKLKSDEERNYDIVLHNEYRDVDSVEIDIPKGYEPESLPQPVAIETKFGKYFSTAKLIDDKILYYRTNEQYSGTFTAKDYTALVNYYEAIYKADRNRIVLVKKEN
ncbi:MAG TPA: DUF3857 domain-containing protein [Chitinophagaceae bacterium]|nr:DUF3857 domain-containing protein [Chitinophagaceae bacterium]